MKCKGDKDKWEKRTRTAMDAPRVQRVILEDLEHGENHLRIIAQDPQSFLPTALEDSLRAGSAHPINHVSRHAEWNAFWDGE